MPSSPSSAIVARSRTGYDEPALVRTDDNGRSWQPHLDLFEPKEGALGGASAVAVTPNGAHLRAGMLGGIACSEDGGRSWARTCPTLDTA